MKAMRLPLRLLQSEQVSNATRVDRSPARCRRRSVRGAQTARAPGQWLGQFDCTSQLNASHRSQAAQVALLQTVAIMQRQNLA